MASRPDDLSPPRRPSGAGRVPPHDLDAEESLLGAMMLSAEAIASATGVVAAADFYKPAHGHVFDAIHSLYAAGQPVDAVTVADELRRAGLLEAIGGPGVLSQIMASTPATTNAGRYARIVEEYALLRRLIAVAGELAELGYSVPEDVPKALDRAEALVYEVNEKRVTDSTVAIADLLSRSLDHLEEIYERGDAITGVPTGYVDLDQLLSGLQKSALLVVGARPGMGKCVAWDTPIVDPRSGAVRTAAEVHRAGRRGEPVEVLALDGDRARVVAPSAFVDDGAKPVFRLRTESGREVRTTAPHPFLTPQGWRPLATLVPGDEVAVPATLPVFGDAEVAAAELERLASAVTRTVADGPEPRIPPVVFRLRRPLLARFLGRVLAGGSVWRPAHPADPPRLVVSMPGRVLAGQVQHLLLRFGVNAAVRTPVVAAGDSAWVTHEVEVAGAELARLASRIAVPGHEAVVASAVRRHQLRPVPAAVGAPVATGDGAASDADAGSDGEGDVRWEEVVSIEPDGLDQVYDLTVPELHNFVAADVFVHNTSFGLGMAAHAALDHHRPVLFFSLEMNNLELAQRLLCAEARIDSSRIRNGQLQPDDWTKISKAMGRLAEAPVWIDDNPNLTIMEIRAKARRLKSQIGDLGAIFVDYLQLMTGRSGAESRQVEVSELSRGLKILARELETPVVALSQLSRGLEMRSDKRPLLSDLRESGSIEQDADVVMFIYREEVYDPKPENAGEAEIIVAKHRSGPTGVVRLAFLPQYTRFANMARGFD